MASPRMYLADRSAYSHTASAASRCCRRMAVSTSSVAYNTDNRSTCASDRAEADGAPLSRYAVTRRFQRILADAGIAKHRYHDLRHTTATLLLAQGVPLRVVMEILGHSLLATTADTYSHVLPVLMADAAEKMNAVLA